MIDEQPAKAFVANTTGLKILEEPFAEEDYAICVSKDNAELTASINEALAKLKADGTLDNIVKNYICLLYTSHRQSFFTTEYFEYQIKRLSK